MIAGWPPAQPSGIIQALELFPMSDDPAMVAGAPASQPIGKLVLRLKRSLKKGKKLDEPATTLRNALNFGPDQK